jgi:hypothetical protein
VYVVNQSPVRTKPSARSWARNSSYRERPPTDQRELDDPDSHDEHDRCGEPAS